MEGGPGATRFFQKGLKTAVEQGEIEILFQPSVEIASGRIVGAEALARWQQPDRDEIGAETLFEAAAQAGLSAELSAYVQSRALAAASAWPAALRDLRLSVNITATDAASPAFAVQLFALLNETGFDPARLTVEIIETELIQNLHCAATMLARLRERGIRIALDDFGTGYSSLFYLKALPLDTLKLDRRLTQDIAGCERDRIVVRGAIAMGRELGLQVVAEGVETQEQLDLLRAAGCEYYQGYLCAPPVGVEGLARLVARHALEAVSAEDLGETL